MTQYQDILQFLSDEIGLDSDSIGILSIARGIKQAMLKLDMNDTNEFAKLITKDKDSFEKLVEEIKVSETWFFRDFECYNYLKSYLSSNLLKYNSKKQLRILSVPCSSGEEPYSVSMLLNNLNFDVSSFYIFACDLSKESISKAQEGIFTKGSFRNNYDNFMDSYFKPVLNNFKIDEKILKTVEFKQENLINPDFLRTEPQFDFIFCKNLLIYLNEESRIKVVENINRLLKNDGALFVGLSEINYFTRNGFEQIKHNMAFACKKVSNIKNTSNEINNFKISKTEKHESFIKPIVRTFSKITESNKITSAGISNNSHQPQFQPNPQPEPYPLISNEELIDEIRLLADQGNFAKAKVICDEILKYDQTNENALFFMGLIHNADRNQYAAEDYFKKVLYLNPEHYESLVHLSLICESRGDSDRATIMRVRAERVYLKGMNKKI
jgi:chemotaxis protein methyltransferase WspC